MNSEAQNILKFWLDIVLAWAAIDTLPSIEEKIHALKADEKELRNRKGEIKMVFETDEDKQDHYRNHLCSSDAMILCLTLAEEDATVTLDWVARLLADNDDDNKRKHSTLGPVPSTTSWESMKKRLALSSARKKLGYKPGLVDILGELGILKVQRPRCRGDTYSIRISEFGRESILDIAPHSVRLFSENLSRKNQSSPPPSSNRRS